MAGDLSSEFAEHLRQAKHLTVADGRDDAAGQLGVDRRQAKLWELVDLPAGEFAEEAARFHGLERVTLQDMMSAAPLASSFSPRFLRETVVFPYRSPDGKAVLAVADPTDQSAQRAAQIVLGTGVVIKVATSEDLAVVLDQRLEQHETETNDALPAQLREDDIGVCAILQAARRWCGPSTICLKRRLNCAPAIFTSSPFRAASWCACASMACCGRSPHRPPAAAGGDLTHQDRGQSQHR